MANEPVTVYLNGHLAGSAAALQILEALQQDSVLGSWASRLHREIEEDRRGSAKSTNPNRATVHVEASARMACCNA
jgi:hypothetical protein